MYTPKCPKYTKILPYVLAHISEITLSNKQIINLSFKWTPCSTDLRTKNSLLQSIQIFLYFAGRLSVKHKVSTCIPLRVEAEHWQILKHLQWNQFYYFTSFISSSVLSVHLFYQFNFLTSENKSKDKRPILPSKLSAVWILWPSGAIQSFSLHLQDCMAP